MRHRRRREGGGARPLPEGAVPRDVRLAVFFFCSVRETESRGPHVRCAVRVSERSLPPPHAAHDTQRAVGLVAAAVPRLSRPAAEAAAAGERQRTRFEELFSRPPRDQQVAFALKLHEALATGGFARGRKKKKKLSLRPCTPGAPGAAAERAESECATQGRWTRTSKRAPSLQ